MKRTRATLLALGAAAAVGLSALTACTPSKPPAPECQMQAGAINNTTGQSQDLGCTK
jgi:hypothetical protein